MAEYDSRPDTLAHIERVRELLEQAQDELHRRGLDHDASKLIDPELDIFNEYTPKLKTSTYGSEEYQSYLKGMGPGLRHHYDSNRHHPEHFANGVHGMTLIDLVEMLADWKAATERHDDGDLARSLRIQKDRFQIDGQLMNVLWNTASEMGWLEHSDGMGKPAGSTIPGSQPLGNEGQLSGQYPDSRTAAAPAVEGHNDGEVRG